VDLDKKPVLVTGATGFIGRRLVARLLAEGCAVRALVLPDESIAGLPEGAVEIVRGSVTDRAEVDRAVDGMDLVFHLAAVVGDWADEGLFRAVTVGGTRSVLSAAAAQGARAVLASSIVVYGDAIGRGECGEDHPFGGALGHYSRSKQEQERIAFHLADTKDLRVTALRLANVYGPGSRPWVEMAIDQLKSGAPSLIDGGRKNAGLCHVDNAAAAFVLAARTDAAVGRAYNVADGSDITWRRYFEDLARIAGCRRPRSLPAPIARIAAHACEIAWSRFPLKGRPPITHEALNLVGSHHRIPIERARREIGFEPRVRYDEGIAQLAASLGAA
jgi:nucleoside-diphosphate-sugar epimerase